MSEIRLIDADKFLKDNSDIVEYDTTHPFYEDTVRELIDNAPTVLTIPDNPTNGDMIKAMFPNIYTEECDYDVFTTLDEETRFTYDWWNAPYKRTEHD